MINSKIKYCYVAGPITQGDQFMNVHKAVAVCEGLRKLGYFPFCPHLSAYWHIQVGGVPYEEWMQYDFAWIEKCDALLRIPGDSPGADREVLFAQSRGIPVFSSLEELLAS